MANKKMTKKEMFSAIIDFVNGAPLPEEVTFESIKAFCANEIEILSRRSNPSNRKPTKTQIENESYKANIMEYLKEVGHPTTIKEMQENIPAFAENKLSCQRITHLLMALCKAEMVGKTYEKKVATFYCLT